ncbi:MAG: M15 family metallopeptidase [Clostridia bacterium]|nr:M15 family metallopeptidase [Clostridia bacterium]
MLKRGIAAMLAAALCLLLCCCGSKTPTPSTTVTTTTTTVTTTTTTATTTTTTTVTTQKTNAAAPTQAPVLKQEELDPTYTRLLLVNAENPLPSDFDNTADLVSIEKKYLNGSLNQIDKGVYPYVISMIEAAKADGVTLYVRSPYRSYNTQKYLFNNKVQRVIDAGTPKEQAEAKAAQAVARPGTSEHQSGLAIDFNAASSNFANTPAFRWMQEHAEDYGFILRYPAEKTNVTGIMYEAWHWRFVGINTAREINSLGVVLEEYLEMKNENAVAP